MIVLPIAILMTPVILEMARKVDWENEVGFDWGFVILLGIIATFGILYGIIGGLNGISTLLNPDYYAVQDLFNLGKTLISR